MTKTKDSKRDIFNKCVFIFLIASMIGAFYEELLHFVKFLIFRKEISWVTKRGLIYGPFAQIYGIGAVLIYLIFCSKERKWYKNFLYGCLLGGGYEYAMSFIQEKIWGTISWDYSNDFLNIAGRTSVPFMLFWGLLILAFIYLLYPLICKIYEKIPIEKASILAILIFAFFVFDISITFVATARQTARHNGEAPRTFIGEFCDKHYTDEYLSKMYNNTKFVE